MNDIIITQDQYALAQIDAESSYDTAYEDANAILQVGLISTESEDSYDKVKGIYFDLVKDLDRIPAIEDVLDEIEIYNLTVMERAVDIVYRFRRDEYTSDYAHSSFDDALEEEEEDIRAQIAETIWPAYFPIMSDEDVFEILSFYGLTFVVSHNDTIYRTNPALAMNDALDVIANDCQVILFPQFTLAWGTNSDPALVHARTVVNMERGKLLCQAI